MPQVDQPNSFLEKYKNLLASSDEEEDDQEIELGMKKSNHELVLVIVESILDDFPANYTTFEGIIKTLREECGESVEIKLARKKIFRLIKDKKVSEVTPTEMVKLVALNRGIYTHNKELKFSKVAKFIKNYSIVSKITILEILSDFLEMSSDTAFEWIEDLKELSDELISGLMVKDLSKATPKILLKIFEAVEEDSVLQNTQIIDFLEENKFKIGFLQLYIQINGQKTTDIKRLKYFEEYIKKLDVQMDKDLSSTKKMDIRKSILTSIVNYLKKRVLEIATSSNSKQKQVAKQDSDSDDSSDSELESSPYTGTNKSTAAVNKLKILGLFIKQLIKSCQNKLELLDHLGMEVETQIYSSTENMNSTTLAHSDVVDFFTNKFVLLQKLVPVNILIYALEHSKSVSSAPLFPQSLTFYSSIRRNITNWLCPTTLNHSNCGHSDSNKLYYWQT